MSCFLYLKLYNHYTFSPITNEPNEPVEVAEPLINPLAFVDTMPVENSVLVAATAILCVPPVDIPKLSAPTLKIPVSVSPVNELSLIHI